MEKGVEISPFETDCDKEQDLEYGETLKHESTSPIGYHLMLVHVTAPDTNAISSGFD